MLNAISTDTPNFCARQEQANQYRQYGSMPVPMSKDTYTSIQAQKKEKNQERWNKAAVISTAVLAASFAAQAIYAGLTHKCTKKALQAQAAYFNNQSLKPANTIESIWEDLTKAAKIKDMALSDELKKLIQEVKNNINNPEGIMNRGGEPIKSILLYGPPGTGKTTFAKAITKEFDKAKFVALDVTKMKDKYVGETEKNINAMIDRICSEAKKMNIEYKKQLGEVIGEDIMRENDPEKIAEAVTKALREGKKLPVRERIFVFIDEIDSVMMVDNSSDAKYSNDMLNEFKKGFTEKLGKYDNIITIGATNLEIDANKAVTRDGKLLDKPMLDRFGRKILVDNPTSEQVQNTIINHYKKCKDVADDLKKESPNLKILSNFLGKGIDNTGVSFRKIKAILSNAADASFGNKEKLNFKDIFNSIAAMKDDIQVSDEVLEQLKSKLGIN